MFKYLILSSLIGSAYLISLSTDLETEQVTSIFGTAGTNFQNATALYGCEPILVENHTIHMEFVSWYLWISVPLMQKLLS